jgi:hypothetical protein
VFDSENMICLCRTDITSFMNRRLHNRLGMDLSTMKSIFQSYRQLVASGTTFPARLSAFLTSNESATTLICISFLYFIGDLSRHVLDVGINHGQYLANY